MHSTHARMLYFGAQHMIVPTPMHLRCTLKTLRFPMVSNEFENPLRTLDGSKWENVDWTRSGCANED